MKMGVERYQLRKHGDDCWPDPRKRDQFDDRLETQLVTETTQWVVPLWGAGQKLPPH